MNPPEEPSPWPALFIVAVPVAIAILTLIYGLLT